jgi:hypothetical protein
MQQIMVPFYRGGQLVTSVPARRAVSGCLADIDLGCVRTPLVRRPDGQAVVNPALILQCQSYRQACRLAFYLRQPRASLKSLAAAAELYAPHVTGYLAHDDAAGRRDLPAQAVGRFSAAVGNTAIVQWLAMSANLTVAEEAELFGV